MRLRGVLFLLPLLLVWTSCIRSPEVVKKKYLENGNKYFDAKKYREASIMYRNAIKKDPRFGEAYYRLGLTELELGTYTLAERSLRRAVELMPTNIEAHKKLAELYLTFGVFVPRYRDRYLDDMRDVAARLLKRDPKSYEGLRVMGIYNLFKGRPRDAITQFEAANAIKPLEPETVLYMVQAMQLDGREAEAEKVAQSLVEKHKTFVNAYDFLYVTYLKKNRISEAEDILKLRLNNNPTDANSYLRLAAFYAGTRREADMRRLLDSLISRPKDFPDGHMLVGRFYRRLGDYDRAIQQYREGVTAQPLRAADYQKNTADVLISQGKRAEAIQLLETVLKHDPKDNQALSMRASLMLFSDKPEQRKAALNDLQAAVRANPKNAWSRFYLGRAYMANGDQAQALLEFQEATKLRPDYVQPQLATAQIHLVRHEFPKALTILNEIVEKRDPGNLPARLMRSTAMLGVSELVQARANVTETLKLYPNSPEVHLQLAIVDLAEQKYSEAEQGFRALYERNPADLRSLYGLAETFMARKQPAQALEALQKEAQRSPDRWELQLAYANLAFRAEKYDVAVNQYQRLLQRRPDDIGLYMRLGDAYRLTGKIDLCLGSYRKAVEKAPSEPSPKLRLSMLLDTLGQRDEAKRLYQDILKIKPNDTIALNNLAYILAETGADLDQALTYAQRAKQVMPQDVNISDTLGWIYIKKNLSDNAIDIFKDLTRRVPDRSTFHYHLAMAFFQKGDKAQAKQSLESALRNKPAKEEEQKIRELLAKIG